MSSRLVVALLLAAALLAATLALRARSEPARVAGPTTAREALPIAADRPGAGEAPAQEPLDLERLRDVFHFADDAPRARPGSFEDSAGARLETVPAADPAPVGPRLVGLVRRRGQLVAALALDGEVELAAAGETAAGVTVLSVTDERVRVRLGDGSERDLPSPE